ncbi:MAG: glycosyltransferase family 4 protein [Bryobacteraceae bacterium]
MLKLLPFLRPARDTKVLVYLHGIEAWRTFGYFDRALWHRVDLALSNSTFTWKRCLEFNRALASVPWKHVALGYEEPAPDSAPNSSLPRAIMVGRMEPGEDYKGHRQVLRAWPRVTERIPGAELVIVGGGALVPDFQRIAAESPAQDSIRFTGAICDKEKDSLLREASCLLMPSSGEGFGIVYLEAMRYGKPCLVSTLDAGQEVVGPEAGIAVDREDPDAMADAIVRLLADTPERRRIGNAARERYESQFTAQHFRKRLIDAIASVG